MRRSGTVQHSPAGGGGRFRGGQQLGGSGLAGGRWDGGRLASQRGGEGGGAPCLQLQQPAVARGGREGSSRRLLRKTTAEDFIRTDGAGFNRTYWFLSSTST